MRGAPSQTDEPISTCQTQSTDIAAFTPVRAAVSGDFTIAVKSVGAAVLGDFTTKLLATSVTSSLNGAYVDLGASSTITCCLEYFVDYTPSH